MKKYKIIYSETFLDDISAITKYIYEKSKSKEIAKTFFRNAIGSIENRSFSALSYEPFFPYNDSPCYYRIYYSKYIIFYNVVKDKMIVQRMLWNGTDIPNRIRQ